MKGKFFFVLFWIFFEAAVAQKCTYGPDSKNASRIIVICVNVASMNDVELEIQSNWTSIQIVNKATHTEFSNVALNVPYLNVIQTLDLSRVGKLKLTDAGFNHYDSLRNLYISNTDIKTLKSSWFTKRTIENLDVSRNSIVEIKKENMKYFPQLRYFDASHNEITTLEAGAFLDSKKLEYISFENNRLSAFIFDDLRSLKQLNLRSNAIVGVWAWTFTKLPLIDFIDLSENEIVGIVDRSFEHLFSLKVLNLNTNKLPYLSGTLFAGSDKTKLTDLDLSYSLITIIYPATFSDLPLLTFLDVSNNKITEIYLKNFETQKLLQTLILNHNRIAKIAPNSFQNLMQLRIMDISHNKLENFELTKFGTKFAGNKLRKLDLSFNDISVIGVALFAILRNLVTLNLSSNKIKSVATDSFKSNINLHEIYFNNNQISFLDPNFFKPFQAGLEIFEIENNRLTFIPDTISLKKVQKISIANNPFQCFCLREFITWARVNRVQISMAKSNPKNPDCVVIETTCIKDQAIINGYDIYDRFLDGMHFD